MKNAQSRKYQRKYFYENELYNYFPGENKEQVFKENFYDNFRFRLESKFVSRDIRQEDFLVRNPENTEELVPCQFIANAMKEEFEKFWHKTTFPVHVCFVRNV